MKGSASLLKGLADVAGFASLALAAAGMVFSSVVVRPRRCTLEEAVQLQVEGGFLKPGEYESLASEPVSILSPYGYTLKGQWFKPEGPPSDKAVILVHGYAWNRIGSLKYIRLFQERGCHVIIYDHGHSGESGGHLVTMGFREKHDLKAVVDAIIARLGENARIGTHGESMGAATVLLHAAMDSRVRFVIADCPYADLTEQLSYRLKAEYGLPPFPLVNAASLATLLQAGFLFRDVSPLRVLEEKGGLPEIPMMFIHGMMDDYIPPAASEKLHAAKKGYSRLCLMPDARHAQSICAHGDLYEQLVSEFLGEVEPLRG
jgi:uncharacterized protein